MKNHLKNKHKLEFNKIEKSETQNLSQTSLMPLPVDKQSVDFDLAMAFGTSTASLRIIENKHFKNALKKLNYMYAPPDRKKASNIIIDTVAAEKKKLKSKIQSKQHIAISTDFWSFRTLGYIGVNVLFFEDNCRKSFLMALKHVPHPHTGSVILESLNEILQEFGIDSINDNKIACIVTDNGANMLKAYSGAESAFAPLSDQSEQSSAQLQDQEEDLLEKDEGSDIEDVSEDCLFDFDDGELDGFLNSTTKHLPCINHKLNNNLKNAVKQSQGIQIIIKEIVSKLKTIKYKGIF